MVIEFTKQEIREFLEEQGFDASDEDVLNKFIKDLKKLIKYEEMRKRRRRLGHHTEETALDSTEDGSRLKDTCGETSTSSGRHSHPHHIGRDPYQHDCRDQSGDHRQDARKGQAGSSCKNSPEKVDRRHQRAASPSPCSSRKQPGDRERFQADRGDVIDTAQPPPANTSRMQRPEPRTKPKPARCSASAENANNRAGTRKSGNRMIMRRVTATTDENGESIVQESDVDLGIVKRSSNDVGNRKPRPQTAPTRTTSKKPVPSDTDRFKGAGEPPRVYLSARERPKPSSSNTVPSRRPSAGADADAHPCIDPDELFFVLREIMFPENESNDDDDEDSLNENPKLKNLPRPPPHVAIDPVALFHWYKKNAWDKYSIPGEDRHMQLRWNVRAKTIGGDHPCVEKRFVPSKDRPGQLRRNVRIGICRPCY